MEHQAKGRHFIATIANGRSEILSYSEYMEDKFKRALQCVPGLTVVDVVTHSFGEGQGCTSVALLAESHASIHTYPEHGLVFFDLFSCGEFDEHFEVAQYISLSVGGYIKAFKVFGRE